MEDNITSIKIFFNKGDIVKLKDLASPLMMVIDVAMDSRYESDPSKELIKRDRMLKGIRCIWFDDLGHVQEYMWNSKDLKKV